MINTDIIQSLKGLRDIKEQAERQERMITSYASSDLKHAYKVRQVWENCKGLLQTPSDRRRVMFVMLYRFSPCVLAGGRIPRKVREALSVILGCHPSVLSKDSRKLMFLYQHYQDFKDDVDMLDRKVEEELT